MGRIDNYKAKVNGDVRKRLYDAQKEDMVKSEAAATKDLVKIEEEVRHLTQGQPIIHIPYYIIFAKEIYSLKKKCSYQTLINEIQIRQHKWASRGLNSLVLDTIKEFYVEAYEKGKCFHLDISLLDGPHGLC